MNAPFNANLRRGACPSLSAPMQTGDGLLVRLLPADGGLTPAQLSGLAAAAARFGNGILEVTQRGSLQIRGLTPMTIDPLNDAVAALGIAVRTGLPVDISPLAGLDPAELADPRSVAHAIRDGAYPLLSRLGPKVSVVVDGGLRDLPPCGGDGRQPGGGRRRGSTEPGWLDAIKADIRLTAEPHDGRVEWRLALAGDAATARPVGLYDEVSAARAAFGVLSAIADLGKDARARDLHSLNNPDGLRSVPPTECLISPLAGEMSGGTEGGGTERHDSGLGRPIPLLDALHAASIALPFGFITAPSLTAFARSAASLGIGEIRLAPRNNLILLSSSASIARSALVLAQAAGFITNSSDPRRFIIACAGAPACASGHYDTRAFAARIVDAEPSWLDGSFRLHLSGCAKGCAEPAGASIALVGGETGPVLVANGISLPAGLREDLGNIQ